jgi:hypothetical protein
MDLLKLALTLASGTVAFLVALTRDRLYLPANERNWFIAAVVSMAPQKFTPKRAVTSRPCSSDASRSAARLRSTSRAVSVHGFSVSRLSIDVRLRVSSGASTPSNSHRPSRVRAYRSLGTMHGA